MLLAHLLPFLDAEIDRLQQARDLLAYSPPAEPTAAPELHLAATPTPTTTTPVISAVEHSEPLNESQPIAAPDAAAAAPAQVPHVIVLKPHVRGRGRYGRRRTTPLTDTALRSSIPTGPIVVSAEQVRRAQAGKGASIATPAASTPTFSWRPPARNKGDVDALLQKLMDLGSKDEATNIHTAPAGLG